MSMAKCYLKPGDFAHIMGVLSEDAKWEIHRQDRKWGAQPHSTELWWLILSEEYGELAKAVLEQKPTEIANEAVHVVAVLLRLLSKVAESESVYTSPTTP